MPRYTFDVSYQRLVTYTATVTVDAPDEETALRLADDKQESGGADFEETDSDSMGGPDFQLMATESDDVIP